MGPDDEKQKNANFHNLRRGSFVILAASRYPAANLGKICAFSGRCTGNYHPSIIPTPLGCNAGLACLRHDTCGPDTVGQGLSWSDFQAEAKAILCQC